MAKLKLLIDGESKTFEKKQFFIRENILALQFSMKQEEYFKKDPHTVEDIEENQVNFAQFISDVFENEFTAEEFVNGCLVRDKEVAEDIYIECLGGKSDEEKGKK